jgi:hypothetical protein
MAQWSHRLGVATGAIVVGAAVVLLFFTVSTVLMIVFVNTVRRGRLRWRYEANDTLRSEHPVQFWLKAAPLAFFSVVLFCAGTRLALVLTGLVP